MLTYIDTIALNTRAKFDCIFDVDKDAELYNEFCSCRNKGLKFHQIGIVYLNNKGHIKACTCCQLGDDCLFNCQAYKNHTCPLYK